MSEVILQISVFLVSFRERACVFGGRGSRKLGKFDCLRGGDVPWVSPEGKEFLLLVYPYGLGLG